MIRRLLVLVLALVGAYWWFRRQLRATAKTSRPTAVGGTRDEGRMVRDRVCNTFIPRSRALLVERGGSEHFFCSERCRDAFLANGGAVRAG